MADVRGATKKRISKRIVVLLIVAASIIVLLLLLLPFNILLNSSQVIKVVVPLGYFVIALVIQDQTKLILQLIFIICRR
jgi:chromate transport protein ChrA